MSVFPGHRGQLHTTFFGVFSVLKSRSDRIYQAVRARDEDHVVCENGTTNVDVVFYPFNSVAKNSEEVVDPIVEVEDEHPQTEAESSD